MLKHFVTASPEESLPEVRQTMRLARLRHLMVAREGRLLGLLSYRTLLESLLEGEGEAQSISGLMVPSPSTVTPTAPLTEAAERLCRYGLGCLPVVDPKGSRLVGILTESDLLRVAFRRRCRAGRKRSRNGSNGSAS